MIARYVPRVVIGAHEDVMEVHPEFDIDRRIWVTNVGVIAPSLRELQRLLPKANIIGYYPEGYHENHRPAYKPGDQIRSGLRTSYGSASSTTTVFSKKKISRVRTAPVLPKLSREEERTMRQRREYEEINGIVPKVDADAEPDHEPQDGVIETDEALQPAAKRNVGTHWTPELDDQLGTLVERGMYAIDIAETMGRGITKNAVIGRCHRKGFKLKRGHGRPNKRK